MTVEQLLQRIKVAPELVEFDQVISTIDQNYHYHPTAFYNGSGDLKVDSAAGKNEGSCKIFSFAKLNELSKEETLACFGNFYREDVLKNPTGINHGNIRAFIEYGWEYLRFEGDALSAVGTPRRS